MFFELHVEARRFWKQRQRRKKGNMSSCLSLHRATAGGRGIVISRCTSANARAPLVHLPRSARTGPDNVLRQRTERRLGATSNDRDTETDTETDTEGARGDDTSDATDSTNAAQQAAAAGTPAEMAGSGIDTTRLSTEEIQKQMGELRRAKEEQEAALAAKEDSLASGVMEEVGLIQWPSFGSAFVNTLLVVAIVFATSFTLFGVNTALTELSGVIYSR